MNMNNISKQVFTLKDENGKELRYTVSGSGQLIPLIETVKEKEEPWKAINSIAETCKILQLSRNTLMRLIYAGELKAIKAGVKRWLVPAWAIEEFIKLPR